MNLALKIVAAAVGLLLIGAIGGYLGIWLLLAVIF